jgi:hypothetical protein
MQISMSIAHLYSSTSCRTPFEPAQPDAGIDLELRAHMRGAVQDALLQVRLARA